jgi:4-amino-4-deoxy-L-arabinose transferase-like glycosyltransferase
MRKETLQNLARNPWTPFWLALAAFSALVFPTLRLNRLLDWDEMTHAIAALEAARDGHWMPLTLKGVPWLEKPPLLPWLTALCIRIFGPGETAARLPTFTFAALAMGFCAKVVARLSRRLWIGLLAALFLFCQTDFLFHSRFITMDSALMACLLAALDRLLEAVEGPTALAASRVLQAGLWLALAAAAKSWFVLVFAPAGLVFLARPPKGLSRAGLFWRLALPPALTLLAWLALYTWAYGAAFLVEEWKINTWGRAMQWGKPVVLGVSNLDFYIQWGLLMAPSAMLVSLPAALRLGLRLPQIKEPALHAGLSFILLFMLCWGLAALGIKHQVINYMLGFNTFACLAAALWLAWEDCAWGLASLALLAILSLLARQPDPPMLALGLGLLLALALVGWAHLRPFSLKGGPWLPWLRRGLLLAWALVLIPPAWHTLWNPPDSNRPLVELMLAHPARTRGELLGISGKATQCVWYYSLYAQQDLPSPPTGVPPYAMIFWDGRAWRFKPAAVPAR